MHSKRAIKQRRARGVQRRVARRWRQALILASPSEIGQLRRILDSVVLVLPHQGAVLISSPDAGSRVILHRQGNLTRQIVTQQGEVLDSADIALADAARQYGFETIRSELINIGVHNFKVVIDAIFS
jgi:hypothetical protein